MKYEGIDEMIKPNIVIGSIHTRFDCINSHGNE